MPATAHRPDPPLPEAERDDKEHARMTQPAHSLTRAPNDMLPPSAAAPQTPGSPGMAGEVPSEPVTHRRTPVAQNPQPSERWFPPVSD
jgi:hypothetical protein